MIANLSDAKIVIDEQKREIEKLRGLLEGVSVAAPAGGSSAAGEGQCAVTSDGGSGKERPQRRLTLVPAEKFEGEGWYLWRSPIDHYCVFFIKDKYDFPDCGVTWKIQE